MELTLQLTSLIATAVLMRRAAGRSRGSCRGCGSQACRFSWRAFDVNHMSREESERRKRTSFTRLLV